MKQLERTQMNALKGGKVKTGAKKLQVIKAVSDGTPTTNTQPASKPTTKK